MIKSRVQDNAIYSCYSIFHLQSKIVNPKSTHCMTVLIITYSQDNESIPLVMNAIEAKGGRAFRFDTDRFPTKVQLDIYYSNKDEQVILTDNEKKLDLNEVSSVWYRRIAIAFTN
ncbi:hypothetical protein NUACC26_052310 [Scytonema sp. NUACC26]